MTAVVGILNKQSVALAADSAVTIGGPGKRKIFNRANKLFALSKCHPIGVMLYNSAAFMGTPWETIIKIYRKQLNDVKFDTVKQYSENFLEFLRAKSWFTEKEINHSYIQNFFRESIEIFIKQAYDANPKTFQPGSAPQKAIDAILSEAEDTLSTLEDLSDVCEEFKNFTLRAFQKDWGNALDEVLKRRLTSLYGLLKEKDKKLLQKVVWKILCAKEIRTSFTGLVFSGFGEKEIFPSMVAYNISFNVGDRLRYFVDESGTVSITHKNPSAISDFAQTDVIRTILSGIAPDLNEVHQHHFEQLLFQFRESIVNIIGAQNPALQQQIAGLDLDALVQFYQQQNKKMQLERHIEPLLSAVVSLSKEDLAEMAESLIYLTYLKRRITFAEESVGGPVDVALISKGDGFVWIKRKHYFAPELNAHFFENYFKP